MKCFGNKNKATEAWKIRKNEVEVKIWLRGIKQKKKEII